MAEMAATSKQLAARRGPTRRRSGALRRSAGKPNVLTCAQQAGNEGAAGVEKHKQRNQNQNRGNKPSQQSSSKQKLEERVIEVRRVCKVIQGGRSVSFRACVAVGDRAGTIGIGVDRAKEVVEAIEKARNKALSQKTQIFLTKAYSVPHPSKVKGDGGAEIDIFPAGVGTGVNAGGACRSVCELAGVQNVFVKQRRTRNYINNAKAVLKGLQTMHNPETVRQIRGFDSIDDLFKPHDLEPESASA